jgi:hypothetical protein
MRQHNESRHISSMDNSCSFHSKKITDPGRMFSAGGFNRANRCKCSAKDTSRNKLLQCIAHFRRNVTFFAGALSKVMSN